MVLRTRARTGPARFSTGRIRLLPGRNRPGRAALSGLLVGSLLAVAGLSAGCQSQSAINREPHAGSSTAVAVAGVQQVTITTDQSYRFSPSTITVHPGKVRIVLRHVGTGAPHDWQLLGLPDDYVPLVTPGQQKSVEFTAPAPGKYTFVCTIHVAQGQTGTLIVLGS
ncbi:MAG TPA: cupredoxin domain-containing protein [Jatrophihabitans sp.]|nr:cupredoxin domain-containing protein [Jatrophihabitans sp.]